MVVEKFVNTLIFNVKSPQNAGVKLISSAAVLIDPMMVEVAN